MSSRDTAAAIAADYRRASMAKHSRTPSSLGSLETILEGRPGVFGKRDSAIPLLPRFAGKASFSWRYRRLAILLATAGAFLYITAQASSHAQAVAVIRSALSAALPLENLHTPANIPTLPSFSNRRNSFTREEDAAWKICPECRDEQEGGYIASQYARIPVPSEKRLRSGETTKAEAAKFILQDIVLASNLDVPKLHVDPQDKSTAFLSSDARSELFHNYLTSPDSMLSFSFATLKPSLPTLYMFTRTADHGRLSGPTRVKYMQRHAKMIKDYDELVKRNGYGDGTGYKKGIRQLLWIVVEDEARLDQALLKMLKESDIPYLYLAYGPSKRWGKTQWNIVLKAVDVLRNNLFADGPVLNVDDDALVLPELLRKVWKVKKAIAWQVGNIPLIAEFGQSFWEGPFYKNGKLVRWQYGGYPERKFRSDMNGFAIHSSVVGVGRQISGPQYVPHNNPQGESEFLEKIYQSEAEIEGLCEDTAKEQCYYSWHNHWMPEEIDDKHLAPAPADF